MRIHSTVLVPFLLGSLVLLKLQASDPEGTYRNPVMAGDYPDPSVIRVGKDYWATATTSEWGPQFPLLRSDDLIHWHQEGTVFRHRPSWAVGNFWAPEISEYRGRFYIYYVARKRGGPLAVAVATADKPGGPYMDHGPLVAQEAGSIDAFPCTDEKGERYLIWKEDGNSRRLPTLLWAQRLTEDGLQLVGERKEILRNEAAWEGAVVEGPCVLRRGEWFYLFYSGNGCCGTGCNYALGVARSRSLLGPFERNPSNPILSGNPEWKCPGHGTVVQDPQGRFFLLYHAYAAKTFVFTGREAMLDEITFGQDGWPVIHGGQGPSVSANIPGAQPQRGRDAVFFDDFREGSLGLSWQWPQDNEPDYAVTKSHRGQLILRPQLEKAGNVLGAVLARSTTSGDYVASISVDMTSLRPGTLAGLSAFGDAANATGLMVGDGEFRLWRRSKGTHEEYVRIPAPATPKLVLRCLVRGGHEFRFATSTDGRHWNSIGEGIEGKDLPPWDRAVRIALTVGGTRGAEARFDWVKIEPLEK